MKKLIVISVLAALVLTGCRTTEANYRSAYEKAVEAQTDQVDFDDTIYGNVRRQTNKHEVSLTDGKTIAVETIRVRTTENGGAVPENLKRYNIVAGQFKQLFNAQSLRKRLADNYSGAFIVETSEPYYYVVAESFADINEAAAALARIRKSKPVPMKEPAPFILERAGR